MAMLVNTAAINNINSGINTLTGFNASNAVSSSGSGFVLSTDGITFGFDGLVLLECNIYMIGSSARSNVGFRWNLGAGAFIMPGWYASSYIRAFAGHNEASSGGSMTLPVKAGQKVIIQKVNLAAGTAAQVDIPANSAYLSAVRL